MTLKVETREPSSVRRELRIEVDKERVAAELDKVLGEVARNARIPGFRPGKIPRSLLRRRFAREIDNELIEHLVPAALGQALGETGLEPVHEPVIQDLSLAEGEPLRFTAVFEVRPRIEPRDYKGVPIELGEARVEEADVLRELEVMREAAAEYVAVEPRPLARGDFALVDLKSERDGEARTQEGALIEVGGEEYHPDFARNLEGMAPGEEKAFEVRYAADDPDPRARGQAVTYTVRVREVKRKSLPDLDDEFARDTGKHQTLAELRAELHAHLERRLERERRRAQEGKLADALLSQVTVEVPQALVERELDRMVEEQASALLARGIDPRTAPIDWRATRDKMQEGAARRVKWELLLEAIARQEGIEPGAEEVEERLRRIADGSGRSLEFVRSKIEKDGRMEELRRSLRLERAVDFLIRNARMEKR